MENSISEPKIKERFFDKKTCGMTALLVLGTFIYCLGVVWLLNCGEFFAGGITGISQLISYLLFDKVSPLLSIFIPLLNIPLFLLGWKSISKKFAFLTLVSVVLQMILIYFLTWLCQVKGFNPIFEVVKRYDQLLIIDGTIVFLSAFVCDFSTALFTFVRLISSIMTIDRFYRIYQYIRIEAVTEHYEEVKQQILTKLHHGVTIYSVIGGYTMKEKKVLQIFASRYEVNDYITVIKKIDPDAFITISNLSTLIGKYNKRSII